MATETRSTGIKPDLRRFDSRVEAQARTWAAMDVDRDEWPDAGNGWVSRGRLECFVKQAPRVSGRTVTGSLAAEKIVSDMATDLGLPVAPGCLWQPPGLDNDKYWYLSLCPFRTRDGNTYGKMLQRPSARAGFGPEKALLAEAQAQNTALFAFHMWIGDHMEHKLPINMLVSLENRATRGIRIAAHDHADAALAFQLPPLRAGKLDKDISYAFPFAGTVPQGWHPAIDEQALDATLARIDAYPRDRLKDVVHRIPGTLLGTPQKEAIVSSLQRSAGETRRWFESHEVRAPQGKSQAWIADRLQTQRAKMVRPF
jgi:hypothetical protein